MDSKLKSGDLLHRSKGLVQHAGVYLGNGLVLHNQPSKGAVITPFSEYADNKEVKIVSTELKDKPLMAGRIGDILANDSRYQLLNNNCEHLASFLINGRKISPQIQASITGLISAALVRSQIKNGHWALWLAGGAIAGLIMHNTTQKYDFSIAPGTV